MIGQTPNHQTSNTILLYPPIFYHKHFRLTRWLALQAQTADIRADKHKTKGIIAILYFLLCCTCLIKLKGIPAYI